jgi:hypothetical protein
MVRHTWSREFHDNNGAQCAVIAGAIRSSWFTMYTSEVLKRTCFQHSTRILWKLAHRTFWYWKPIQLLLGISSEESSYHYCLQRLRGKM